MTNFIKVARDLPIQPLIEALNRMPMLWDESTFRQSYPGTAHRDTQAIHIRCCYPITAHSMFHDLEAHPFPAFFPLKDGILPLVDAMSKTLHIKRLGRVMIVSLKPDGVISQHCDEGPYAEAYERVHISLQSDPGNVFHCGQDSVHMQPGEAWWFNHRRLHSVANNSFRERVHLIMDVQCERPIIECFPEQEAA